MSEEQAGYLEDALEMMGIVEPKKIVTEVSGFIPVFEVVLHHYKDYMTALVFGRMWQYCGMSDGVCKASLEKIGNDIEVSSTTVMRHAEKLVADGYLIDTTPDRRNAPHIYMDGGRVVMKNRISAGMPESRPSIIKSKPTVINSDASIINSQLIKQDNTKIKQDNTAAADFGDICKVYTDNIGMLTPMISDELKDIADTYPAGWFGDAVKEAVKNNVRKLNYVKKILESWKTNGRGEKKEQPKREEGKGFYV